MFGPDPNLHLLEVIKSISIFAQIDKLCPLVPFIFLHLLTFFLSPDTEFHQRHKAVENVIRFEVANDGVFHSVPANVRTCPANPV